MKRIIYIHPASIVRFGFVTTLFFQTVQMIWSLFKKGIEVSPVFSGIVWSDELLTFLGLVMNSVFLGLIASVFAIVYNKLLVPTGGAIEYDELVIDKEKA